jgi:hypothetical protein
MLSSSVNAYQVVYQCFVSFYISLSAVFDYLHEGGLICICALSRDRGPWISPASPTSGFI